MFCLGSNNSAVRECWCAGDVTLPSLRLAKRHKKPQITGINVLKYLIKTFLVSISMAKAQYNHTFDLVGLVLYCRLFDAMKTGTESPV